MSFMHCHGCGWEQDDFWSWRGYNPLRFFLGNELRWYWWPRMVDFDPPPHSLGRVHSWYVLALCARKWLRRLYRQQWWTYTSWKRAYAAGGGKCPTCGASLCID